jgi:hypothetical protein
VAVGEHLVADPVVRDEAPHAPVVGAVDLGLHGRERHVGAGEAVGDSCGHQDVEVPVPAQRDRRLLEAGQHGHALDEDLEVLPGLVVGPRTGVRGDVLCVVTHGIPPLLRRHRPPSQIRARKETLTDNRPGRAVVPKTCVVAP